MFCCAALENLIATSLVEVWHADRSPPKNTTFNTGKFRNHILHCFAHGCVGMTGGKTGGVGPACEDHDSGIGIARA